MPSARTGWRLWEDWCRATRQPDACVDTQRLLVFQDQVSASSRYLADIAATARELGVIEIAGIDPWVYVESQFAPLDECLRGCSRAGWPSGLRDAWVLVLTRGLRLTRSQASAVRSADLDPAGWRVHGRQLTVNDAPQCCQRCVAARWLTLRETLDRWGRNAAWIRWSLRWNRV